MGRDDGGVASAPSPESPEVLPSSDSNPSALSPEVLPSPDSNPSVLSVCSRRARIFSVAPWDCRSLCSERRSRGVASPHSAPENSVPHWHVNPDGDGHTNVQHVRAHNVVPAPLPPQHQPSMSPLQMPICNTSIKPAQLGWVVVSAPGDSLTTQVAPFRQGDALQGSRGTDAVLFGEPVRAGAGVVVNVGPPDGVLDGRPVGSDGIGVGTRDGAAEGRGVGAVDGKGDGANDGASDGSLDGTSVGARHGSDSPIGAAVGGGVGRRAHWSAVWPISPGRRLQYCHALYDRHTPSEGHRIE